MPMARTLVHHPYPNAAAKTGCNTGAEPNKTKKMNVPNFQRSDQKLSLSTMGLDFFSLRLFHLFPRARSKKFATVLAPDCRSASQKIAGSKTEMAKAQSRHQAKDRDRAFCALQGFLPGRRADRVVPPRMRPFLQVQQIDRAVALL